MDAQDLKNPWPIPPSSFSPPLHYSISPPHPSILIGASAPFVEPRWGSIIGVIGNPACATRHWALECNAFGVKPGPLCVFGALSEEVYPFVFFVLFCGYLSHSSCVSMFNF